MAITRKAGNWQQYLKVSCATVMAGALMVSCSGADKDASAGEEKDGKAKNAASSAAEKKWDTGIYVTKYRTPFDDSTVPPSDAIVPESNQLAKNVLLPYELDPELRTNRGSSTVLHSGRLSLTFGPTVAKAGDPFDDKLQSGYYTGANDDNESHQASWAVLRYDSAETAKEAAAAYGKAYSELPDFLDDDGSVTFTPVNYQPLSAPATAVKANYTSLNSEELNVATSFNEYVLLSTSKLGDSNSVEDEQKFLSEFFTKQTALLTAMPAHKTEAGFGTNDGYAPYDPDGLFRYVVKLPEEYRDDYMPFPASMNARALTGIWMEQDLMSAALKAAGVETAFVAADTLMKARNPEAAASLASTLLSYDTEDGWEEYVEPQDLPNTRCLSRDEAMSTVKLQCYTHYDDFVVYGSTSYSTKERGKDANSADANADENAEKSSAQPKDENEAKTRLSQMFAAQLMIFEDAKKNPEGTPPETQSAEETEDAGKSKDSEKKSEDTSKSEDATKREDESEDK